VKVGAQIFSTFCFSLPKSVKLFMKLLTLVAYMHTATSRQCRVKNVKQLLFTRVKLRPSCRYFWKYKFAGYQCVCMLTSSKKTVELSMAVEFGMNVRRTIIVSLGLEGLRLRLGLEGRKSRCGTCHHRTSKTSSLLLSKASVIQPVECLSLLQERKKYNR